MPIPAAGIVGAYLNKRQRAALNELIEEKGVTQGQVMKEIVIRALVEEELLPEAELAMVLHKQESLREEPHGNYGKRKVAPEPEVRPAGRRRKRAG